MQYVGRPGPVASRNEPLVRALQEGNRVVEPADPARRNRQGVIAPGEQTDVAEPIRYGSYLLDDGYGAWDVPSHVENLGHGDRLRDPLASLEQVDQALQVPDRGVIRVGLLRGFGGPRQVRPLAILVVAQPEVVSEQVKPAVDTVRVGLLDPVADPAVELGPQAEWQTLVGNFLGRDVLEQVGVLDVAVEADQVDRPQLVQLVDDLVESLESIRDNTRLWRLSGNSSRRSASASAGLTPRAAIQLISSSM